MNLITRNTTYELQMKASINYSGNLILNSLNRILQVLSKLKIHTQICIMTCITLVLRRKHEIGGHFICSHFSNSFKNIINKV